MENKKAPISQSSIQNRSDEKNPPSEDLKTFETKDDKVFKQLDEINDTIHASSSLPSSTNLYSDQKMTSDDNTFNESQTQVTNMTNTSQTLSKEQKKPRKINCLIVVFLFLLMGGLIKCADLLIQRYSNENKQMKPSLQEQSNQLRKFNQIQKLEQQPQNKSGKEINKNPQVENLKKNSSQKDEVSDPLPPTDRESSNLKKDIPDKNRSTPSEKDKDVSKKQQENKQLKNQTKQQNQSSSIQTKNLDNLTQHNRKSQATEVKPAAESKKKEQKINETTSIDKSKVDTVVPQKSTNFTLRAKFRELTPPIPPAGQDKYEYNSSADDLVANSALKKKYRDAFWLSHQLQIGVEPAQHQRAIRLLQLTHNINFRGQFVMDHYNFYPSPQAKYETLKKLMDEQKEYFDKTYQISKYIHDQVRFCIYTPSFNNAHNRIYLRNLDSIFQQEYTNYHVVYVDDASTDSTGQFVEKYMIENNIPPSMYTIVHNKVNMGGSHNIYVAGNNFCKPGEIMVLADGDDMLIGRQVLSLLNAYYQQHKPAIVYTQFLFIRNDHVGNATNRQISPQILKEGTWRKKRDFVTWHLKTFYTDLFRKVKKQDLHFGPDEWIPYSSDVAYMTPMIEMSGTRLHFLKETVHEYRHDTNANEPAKGFAYSNPKIFNKKPYSYVQDLPFILNPITTHYERLPDEEKKLMQERENISKISVQDYDPRVNQTQNQTSLDVANYVGKQQNTTSHRQVTKNQTTATKTPQKLIRNEQNWKLREKFRSQTPSVNQKLDLYEFKQSSDDLVANSALKKFYNDSPWLPKQVEYGVGSVDHQRAIRLIEVTHNINLRGEFVFDHFNNYKSGQEKYQTLKKLLDEQKKYYQNKYQISDYIHKQLRFCVMVTSFNNMKNRIYLRNLDSIFQQQYRNYHVVYVNDASTDGTKEYVQKYMEENQIPIDMYTLINNDKNMLNTHNTYMAAHQYCKLGEIMTLVDGDDALIGRQVFSVLNAFYQKQKPALVYTQLLFIYPDHIGNSRNQPINTTVFETTGAWRKQGRFCTSHLKTFYVDLFRMIKKEDLQFGPDEWIPHSPDVAYMTPMLQMAGHRVKFLTEITYEYRHDTNANQAVEGFRKVNPKIFAKKPYSLVKDLPFADKPITTEYL